MIQDLLCLSSPLPRTGQHFDLFSPGIDLALLFSDLLPSLLDLSGRR